MKKLIIVESPAKIKTIKKFLDKEYNIMSTMGHVKDLPPKKIGVSIENGINIEYVVIKGKEETIASICKQASTADTIFLAPDPDREGEIIAWHIGQEIKKVAKKKAKIYRIAFNEITKTAIIEAIDHPGKINMELVSAQQARRVLDRWVGYEVSPILWKKVAPGLSAGRVQSVTLRLICDREQAIRVFKPEEYWSITGIFGYNKSKITAALTQIGTKKIDIKNKKTADSVVNNLKNQSYTIDKITDKTRTKNPLPPFMTSTLQQDAYNKLGFSVKKTMQIAQRLYEGLPLEDKKTPIALITYMRTDSKRISDTALKQVRSYITKHYTKKYLPPKAHTFEKKKVKGAQEAHEAIRPIDVNLIPQNVRKYLPPDAEKLYDLIWKRFVACQMNPAQYAQRQVVIKGGKYVFKVTGSTLIFDGFLKVYRIEEDEKEGKEGKVILPPDLQEKKTVALKKIDPKQHFTQPPPRYSEATLVKELEKEGIGRPSTYATILNTIRARQYTNLEKKRFVPTELGMLVIDLLVKNLPDIMDTKFTALMEQDLDKVAQGDLERDKLLKKFYKTFQKDLKAFIGKEKGKAGKETEITCPKCKKVKIAIRFGKAGEFLGCLNYPDCTFTSNFTRDEQGKITLVKTKPPKILKEKCPQCDKPLREISGKFGNFVACSGYPKCKYIKRNIAKFACPQCGGQVVEKAWRGGKFWGCDNYPKCKLAVFDEIDDKKKCPECKWPFLVKKTSKEGKVTYLCANKACKYKKAPSKKK